VSAQSLPATGAGSIAPLSRRFLARFIDGIIIGLPLYALVPGLRDASGAISVGVLFIIFLVGAVYEIFQIGLWGQTIGKRLFGIKVVRLTDGEVPGLGAAAIRYLLPQALLNIPVLNLLVIVVYLRAAFDPLRQGFHDRAAGTIVVRA
jgi:uncharacterized RDD family membrane protein YckC